MITISIELSKTDIKSILDEFNELYTTKITVEELMANSKMLAYFIEEFEMCKDEIIEGSYAAMANDWLCELSEMSA